MTRLCSLLTLVLLLLVARTGLADIPAPPRPKDKPSEKNKNVEVVEAPLAIVADGDGPMRITIPRKFAPLAGQSATDGKTGLNDAPNAEGRGRTIVAGIALSLALAIGGVLLMRRGGRGPRIAATMLLVVAGLAVAGTALADLLPRGNRPRPRPEKGPVVVIEYVDQGDAVTVVLGGDFGKP